MAETTSAPSLRELSERASPGEWHHCQPFMTVPAERTVQARVPAARVDYISTWPGLGTPPGHRIVVPMEGRESAMSSHDMAFVARLVSDYRAGRLIDPTTLTEAVAAARAETERYEMALKLAMRLVQRCVGEGIAFEEDDPLPELESWKVAEAIAETLGIDMNSAAYVDLFKGPLTPGGRTDG